MSDDMGTEQDTTTRATISQAILWLGNERMKTSLMMAKRTVNMETFNPNSATFIIKPINTFSNIRKSPWALNRDF